MGLHGKGKMGARVTAKSPRQPARKSPKAGRRRAAPAAHFEPRPSRKNAHMKTWSNWLLEENAF